VSWGFPIGERRMVDAVYGEAQEQHWQLRITFWVILSPLDNTRCMAFRSGAREASRFRYRNAQKRPTRNTVAKKRAGREAEDSDYLFGNLLQLFACRSTDNADPNRRIEYPPEWLFSLAVLKDAPPQWALAYTTIRRSENTNEL
jgi:hypothetical protein